MRRIFKQSLKQTRYFYYPRISLIKQIGNNLSQTKAKSSIRIVHFSILNEMIAKNIGQSRGKK